MTELRLCTWNAGKGTRGNLAELMDRYEVICGQEWGDRDDLTRFAREQGWTVIEGDQDGSASTPLLVSGEITVRKQVSLVMLHSQNLGPGAGPSQVKQKCAVGGLLSSAGQVFGVVSTHLVASQQFRAREQAARTHIKHLELAFDPRKYPWFIGGDFNCTPAQDQLGILYRSGWTNTARADQPLDTHGQRCIDYLWWQRKGGITMLSQRTHETNSDHRALGAVIRLR